jgi:hypothetical protein
MFELNSKRRETQPCKDSRMSVQSWEKSWCGNTEKELRKWFFLRSHFLCFLRGSMLGSLYWLQIQDLSASASHVLESHMGKAFYGEMTPRNLMGVKWCLFAELAFLSFPYGDSWSWLLWTPNMSSVRDCIFQRWPCNRSYSTCSSFNRILTSTISVEGVLFLPLNLGGLVTILEVIPFDFRN